MPALAITDHGTMFGVIDFYQRRQARRASSRIIGMEAYLAAARHAGPRPASSTASPPTCCCWPRTRPATRTCCRSPRAAQLEGFYYYPRIDHEFLASHTEGLICTSGCMSGRDPARCWPTGQPEAGPQAAGLVLRGLRAGPLLHRTAAPRHPRAGTRQPAPARAGPALRRPLRRHQRCALRQPGRRRPAGYPALPSRPARCSAIPTACA